MYDEPEIPDGWVNVSSFSWQRHDWVVQFGAAYRDRWLVWSPRSIFLPAASFRTSAEAFAYADAQIAASGAQEPAEGDGAENAGEDSQER